MDKVKVPYLSTSVAYAVALAIHEGFGEIGMYGCDFTYPNTHIAESGRGCVEFMLGMYVASGGKVYIPQGSTLMQPFKLYGYPADHEIHKKVSGK
jgi:hypothetical protein